MIHLDKEWSTYKKLLFFQAMGGGVKEYEITGNPVSFATNVQKPLSAFTIPFLPVQSGTGDPSPENVRPIIGWTGLTAWRTGKNLCFGVLNKAIALSQDGVIVLDSPGTVLLFYCKKGESYTYSGVDNNRNLFAIFDSVPSVGSSTSVVKQNTGLVNKTFVADKDGFGALYVANSVIDASVAQIEIGGTASPYAEYTGQSYPVTFPDGETIYGGTLDAVTGVLSVDKAQFAFKDLVALNGASPNWAYNSTYNLFETQNAIIPTGTANTETGIVCSCYQSRPYGYNSSYSSENSIVWAHTSGTLRIKDNRYTDVDVWKTAIADEQIVIPLATPVEIQLDPLSIATLIGDNVIWTDTNGENTVKFKKKG